MRRTIIAVALWIGAVNGALAWGDYGLKVAQQVYPLLPTNHVLDEAYYTATLPIIARRVGLAGVRLARMLNGGYAASQCPVP